MTAQIYSQSHPGDKFCPGRGRRKGAELCLGKAFHLRRFLISGVARPDLASAPLLFQNRFYGNEQNSCHAVKIMCVIYKGDTEIATPEYPSLSPRQRSDAQLLSTDEKCSLFLQP